MELMRAFIDGATIEPLLALLRILALGPGDTIAALAVISVIFFLNEFLKTSLMIEYTSSRLAHVGINVMTLLPAVLLAVVLLYAGYVHPARIGTSFLVCVAAFVPWYVAAALTRLGRRDSEGADVGFMCVGLAVVVAAGIVAAILF